MSLYAFVGHKNVIVCLCRPRVIDDPIVPAEARRNITVCLFRPEVITLFELGQKEYLFLSF